MYNEAVKSGGLAVVTGAASGVGRVAALRFAQAGFGVVLADLPGEKLDEAPRRSAPRGQERLRYSMCQPMSPTSKQSRDWPTPPSRQARWRF